VRLAFRVFDSAVREDHFSLLALDSRFRGNDAQFSDVFRLASSVLTEAISAVVLGPKVQFLITNTTDKDRIPEPKFLSMTEFSMITVLSYGSEKSVIEIPPLHPAPHCL
jgi:hypothetical protein